MHRQREALSRSSFGLGKIDVGVERRELMHRRRVIDAASDSASLEGCGEVVAVASLHANRVLVIHVVRLGGDRRGDDAPQVRREVSGVGLTGDGPLAELAELGPADRGVQVGHTKVVADDLVGVAAFHTLVAQKPAGPLHLRIVNDDHAALTRHHVLRRIEGERRSVAPGSHRHAIP